LMPGNSVLAWSSLSELGFLWPNPPDILAC
jgi:hypothetical protein